MKSNYVPIRDKDGFWPALEEYDPKLSKQHLEECDYIFEPID